MFEIRRTVRGVVAVLRRRRTGCAGDSARYTRGGRDGRYYNSCGGCTGLSKKRCLTTLAPARVALRVPKQHGLFSVLPSHLEIAKRTHPGGGLARDFPKRGVFAKRTQLKNVHLHGHEKVRKTVSWVRFAKRGKKTGFKRRKWGETGMVWRIIRAYRSNGGKHFSSRIPDRTALETTAHEPTKRTQDGENRHRQPR